LQYVDQSEQNGGNFSFRSKRFKENVPPNENGAGRFGTQQRDTPHGVAQVSKLQNGIDQHQNPFKDPPRKSSAIFGPQNYQKPSKAQVTPRPLAEKKGTKEHDK